jgi:hypothetical protein
VTLLDSTSSLNSDYHYPEFLTCDLSTCERLVHGRTETGWIRAMCEMVGNNKNVNNHLTLDGVQTHDLTVRSLKLHGRLGSDFSIVTKTIYKLIILIS